MTRYLTRVAAPSGDVVTLAEAKAHLRVTSSYEDDRIAGYLAAATARLDARDGILGRALLTQDWAWVLPSSAVAGLGRVVTLRFPPVQQIVQVSYVDGDGVSQTYPAANYRLGGDADRAFLELVSGAAWPGIADRSDALTITWRAGYGSAADVPAGIRHAIQIDVAMQYRNRDGGVDTPTDAYDRQVLPFIVTEGLT